MPPRVYVETSVISHLASRPSRDLVVAGHQQITHEWWQQRRRAFQLVASQLVVQEAAAGDPALAKARLGILAELELLEATDEARELARSLSERGPIPSEAAEDALHIAIAVANGVDYLLTWNCKHIANAAMRSAIEDRCRSQGYEPAVLCTPEELLEE